MGNRRIFLRNIGLYASSGLLLTPAALLASENIAVKEENKISVSNGGYFNESDILATLIGFIEKNDSKGLNNLLSENPGLGTIKDERDRSLTWIAAGKGKNELYPVLLSGYAPDIFDCAVMGDTKGISELVKADPYLLNSKNKFGYTPLLAACECGAAASAGTLVGMGARMDYTLPRDLNKTVLTLALSINNPDSVEAMLQAMLGNGANPNKSTDEGISPLHLAVVGGNIFAVKILLRKNADITLKNKEGKTPIDYVDMNKNGAEIRKLIQSSNELVKDLYLTRYERQGKNIKSQDDTYGLPYSLINEYVTFAHFNFDRTKELVTKIPDLLLVRASWDELAVEGCCHTGMEPIVKFLLDKGSPLSVCTAVMVGEAGTVKEMLQKDKRIINERGPHDFALFWYTAIGRQKIDIAELLLASGADVNENMKGRSALSECASRGHAELAEFLCSKGADVNMKSLISFLPGTPLEIAKRKNNTKVVDVLVKYGAK